jgi:hypothetical protein
MLRLLIENAELRESAAKKARERILNHYLWPEITKQVAEVYLNLMERPRAARKPPATTRKTDVNYDSRTA